MELIFLDVNNACGKLLTIAIPTYNRAEYLKVSLEHVLSQIEVDERDVEILISDNASTDETPELMKDFCSKYPFINYIRNETNVGPDRNFLQCLSKGNGRFVHLLSDDDVLLPGSIKKIKTCILENPGLCVVFLNFYLFVGEYQVLHNPPSIFNYTRDKIYPNPDQFIEELDVHVTFLSALVFKKQSFIQITNPEKYIGTYLLQAHLAYKCISSGNNALISHPCIAARCDKGGGYDFYRVFVYEWKKLLFETGIESGFNRTILEKIYMRTIKNKVRRAVRSYKLEDTKDFGLNDRNLLLQSTWMYIEAWIYVYPYAYLPRSFITGLKKTENFFKRFRKK